MLAGIYFGGAVLGGLLGIQGPLELPDQSAGIVIGGVPVTARVRVQGVTIHDVLNDAPNTASLTIEGEAPAVGQRVRITIGGTLLFAGSIQTIDQAYESLPELLVWRLTCIDDTPIPWRPFGTWVETSATTIAQAITTTYAPGFSAAGIEAGLPPVTIVFDGADTFIACLARLATAVGGYCKIDDGAIYLFTQDLSEPPDPLNLATRFLTSPPLQVTTDVSQIRTRVYGKGYGEAVTADLNAGAPMWPIADGALFPPFGGTAIAGLTPDGAQSEKVSFAGVVLATGGSLVGTGSSPSTPPVLELKGGSGVTPGVHTVSVAYRTAAGQSLAGPPSTITTGTHAPPELAPTANPATPGTGPDEGSHDYAVAYALVYGETVAGPASNAVTTSAASGQLPAPGAVNVDPISLQGAGCDDGYHDYKATFVNANGETDAGPPSPSVLCEARLTGATSPVTPVGRSGLVFGTTGGNLTPGTNYVYAYTNTTAMGESLPAGEIVSCALTVAQDAIPVPLPMAHPDPRVTGSKVYRKHPETPGVAAFRLVATIATVTQPSYLDTASDASIASHAAPPTVDTTANPGTMTPFNRIQVVDIPTGPAGTTGRRLYRRFQTVGAWKLVTAISGTTETTYLDSRPNSSLGADAPTSNTTGTAVQRVPVTNIPLGPPGVLHRKLYRRFNGAGPFKLVTTLTNNTATTFTDTVANAALGAASLTIATAVGNQIGVKLPIGPAAVTARELYVSPVGGPRRLLYTQGDNTLVDLTIISPDSAMTGPLEPTADTSGLQQPTGQVNPGATVLPVASPAPFRPDGGWVVLGGGQVVFHFGVSGNTLTGIPASGSGSITTAVLYGQQAIPSAMLVGVTGLTKPMRKGSAVHLWVQRDDALAQAEHAARTGGYGLVEFLIVDQRRGVDSLVARCDADLALFSRPIVNVRYATRDMKTKSGKAIWIDLPSQGLPSQVLTIQEVTITEIGIARGLAPRYTVQASSVRFSLEDTLRRLVAVGPVSVHT